jgi:hypothetical protein
MKRPHWPLTRVKALAAKDGGLFIQRTRALDFFETFGDAVRAARAAIAGLGEAQFSSTVTLTWDVADVYGVRIEGHGWYLKLTIDEGVPEVAVISFHPLERPLKTNGGMVRP